MSPSALKHGSMLTFLHLSDIHFRHNWAGKTLDPDEELRNELQRDIVALAPQMQPVTGILISGDVAYSGKSDEFEFARTWLDALCEALGCDPTRVWCVPGNHDIDRTRRSVAVTALQANLAGMSADDYDSQLVSALYEEDGEVLFKPFHDYNEFAKPLGCSTTRLEPYWEALLPLGDNVILTLRGLNSALLCGPDDGDVAKNQLAVGSCQSTHNRKRGCIRLTLCHHPSPWLKDEAAFEERLQAANSVPIQLYGHEHRFQVEKKAHYLRLHAGAFQPSRTEPGWTPRYNWLRLQVDETSCPLRLSVEVHPRTWTKDRQFEPDSASCDGRDHFVWSMNLDMGDFPCHALKPDPVTGITQTDQVDLSGCPEHEGLAELDRERSLHYQYMRLPFVDAVRIASKMELIETGDENANDLDKRKFAFRRAVEKGLLDDLERLLRNTADGPSAGK